ncbi:MAG: hypothetical protein JWP80_1044 [Pseudomonas sp.]|nr:hypothetical protein [Pseudomonas sp.]
MNSTAAQKRSLGHNVIFGLVVGSIWLPIAGFVIILSSIPSRGVGLAALAVVDLLEKLFYAEVVAIVSIILYALCARPWRLKGGVRATFLVHMLVVAVVIAVSVGGILYIGT